MKSASAPAAFLLLLLAARPGAADPSTSRPAAPVVAHETSVYLDIGFGTAPVPASRLSVPAGEKLRLVAPLLDAGTNYIWTKNGRALAGAPDSNILTLPFVGADDAGTYACLFSTPTTLPRRSQALVLGVGPVERVLNVSTRGFVGPAPEHSLTTGFVIGGSGGPKKLILRAVGPSLAAFGVATPLRRPVLRIHDAAGNLYENAYSYPAVEGGLTYAADLSASLARAGVFALPPEAGDIVELRPFEPGVYTATVTSGDGTSGTVLLELYEVP
jgi:hypothetical protein